MAPLKTLLFPPTLGAINSLGNLNLLKPPLEPQLWLCELWPSLEGCACVPEWGHGEGVQSRALRRLREGGGGPWSHVILSPIPQQPKPTKGRMRIHCLENVDKALQFLKEQKVHLENMGSHDIVDGNHRLTLGLVWTIILRFQVAWQSVTQSVLHTSVPYRERAPLVHGVTDKNTEGLEPRIAVYGCCDIQAADLETLLLTQGRDQCGCCHTSVAGSLWPGLFTGHMW